MNVIRVQKLKVPVRDLSNVLLVVRLNNYLVARDKCATMSNRRAKINEAACEQLRDEMNRGAFVIVYTGMNEENAREMLYLCGFKNNIRWGQMRVAWGMMHEGKFISDANVYIREIFPSGRHSRTRVIIRDPERLEKKPEEAVYDAEVKWFPPKENQVRAQPRVWRPIESSTMIGCH
jgi:hypothetical protein